MKCTGLFLSCLVAILTGQSAHAAPPFSGTIFIDPDIITASDPTTFTNAAYAGQGTRTMFDRRVNAFISLNAYLFNARFDDGLVTEIQVNPEFGNPDAASIEANKYARVIGRLPTISRSRVQTVWIHQGVQPFGGGNNNLLIHVGQSALYEADGILEETLVHESGHTSLDPLHASAPGWLAAQTADPEFISTYARDNPTREDIAESYLPWLAIRHRPHRISATLSNTIAITIPNRLAYFDSQNFAMYPIVQEIAVYTGASTNAANERTDNAGLHVFPGTLTGGTSASQTFTIRNRGGNNLNELALAKSAPHPGDFVLGALGATTLAPNATTTFTVTFAPTSGGTRNAVVNIASNDGNENPFRILVRGYSPLLVTRQPANTGACLGSSAVFAVTANSTNTVFQWQRREASTSNFVNVAFATNSTYILPAAAAADDGAGFRAVVTSFGTNVTSSEALLSVVTVSSPTAMYSFNGGLLTNATLYGDASLATDVLQLHPVTNDRSGALLTDDLAPGKVVHGFAASFKVQMISGAGGYADGFSFNWATNLPNGPYLQAEEGEGSGLRVCFDTYNNGGTEGPAIDVKWGTNTIGHYVTTNGFLPGFANDFADVSLRLHTNGTLDVSYRCVPIFTRLLLADYSPFTGARFGIGGRTGGVWESHTFDDLALQLFVEPATITPPRLQNVVRLDNGSVKFDFTNSPATGFVVLASTNLALPLGDWIVLGPPTESPPGRYHFTDPQATNGARRFYRVRLP